MSLPNEKTKFGFRKRESFARGTVSKDDIAQDKITISAFDELSFHNLIIGVMNVSESILSKQDLEKVEHFHGIRNKIYHLGDGIIPTQKNFDEYLHIAEELLKALLSKPVDETEPQSKQNNGDSDDLEFLLLEGGKEGAYEDLCFHIMIAVAHHRPSYALRTFQDEIETLMYAHNLAVEENFDNMPPYQEQQIIQDFSKIVGKKIDDIELIKASIQDINYLRLAAILPKINGTYDDLDNYLSFKKYAQSKISSDKKNSKSEIESIDRLWQWHQETIDKLYNFMKNAEDGR